ncbi:hypothetical protein [Acinetobacter sp.]|uniref:hypothetical protein n=1 Tax=Acinetobacter sp. TaxID=472 RepID=UPI003BB19565
MNTKVDEGKLISGKEAYRLIGEGVDVLAHVRKKENLWQWEDAKHLPACDILNDGFDFRLKPRTISINGIEVPAPADDKDYHHQGIWILNSLELKEYGYVVLDITDELPRYWWKSEEEIKQVVSALRQVFGGSHE